VLLILIIIKHYLHHFNSKLLVKTVTLDAAIIAAAIHGCIDIPHGRKMPENIANEISF
jgi:hypothetical protein